LGAGVSYAQFEEVAKRAFVARPSANQMRRGEPLTYPESQFVRGFHEKSLAR